MLNEDYRDMLRALSDEKARFILVGAYALAAHGYPRATMDIVNKRATGRTRDLADAEALESLKQSE
jgi:hypothetical protein